MVCLRSPSVSSQKQGYPGELVTPYIAICGANEEVYEPENGTNPLPSCGRLGRGSHGLPPS